MQSARRNGGPDPRRMAQIRKNVLSHYERQNRKKRIMWTAAALGVALTLATFIIHKDV